ncbi:hypothetical protein VOLCADRAFT_89108 [Volvox carteri f. nagariensis]|uniref:Uncharacterized protein n=1 Tax=Volvox carteri f. nagariensis TaxID=3068 RepID=D8TQT9_VOLCA|nr:uncharacterized protein VOLCADRAFT_89108 [Volvox carteri f. nagariensis]EFJ50212.1 hypothetical protein VOLCADRAFT_89108 [Volvox carteri f. nagariensis]|eukprot:XP_002948832.1 hypothetical protein VOLCADRAFT_89108 [Volvox carteri f. nagariensis]
MSPFDHLRTTADCDRELVSFPPLSSDDLYILQRVEDQLLAIDEALATDLGQQEQHLPVRASKSAKDAHTAKLESIRRKHESQRSRLLRANPSVTDLKTHDAARLAIQERKLQLVFGIPLQGWHPLPSVGEDDAALAGLSEGGRTSWTLCRSGDRCSRRQADSTWRPTSQPSTFMPTASPYQNETALRALSTRS